MKKIFFTLICFFLFTYQLTSEEFTNQEIEIYKNLRCLICQGQSIADSNSDFAQTIKIVVRDQLEKGKSEVEVYNFLISKYGEWIVYKPKLNKNNFLLWFLPYLILLLGGTLIFSIVKKRAKIKTN